jgi:hypothetical protein
MDKEELKQYLKDNLELQVFVSKDGDGTWVKVKIYLEGELLSEDRDSSGDGY